MKPSPSELAHPGTDMNAKFPESEVYVEGVVQGLVPHNTEFAAAVDVVITLTPEEIATIQHKEKTAAAGVTEPAAIPAKLPHPPFLVDDDELFRQTIIDGEVHG